MATNVLEIRPFTEVEQEESLLERVTIRQQGDIDRVAHELHAKVRACGLKLMAWHDLSTIEQILDQSGAPLNRTAFGWPENELAESVPA